MSALDVVSVVIISVVLFCRLGVVSLAFCSILFGWTYSACLPIRIPVLRCLKLVV